ncbi:MAG TPA: ornithine cyclodeaminase family protein [Candidatus Binatia bacterium]|nr:ornithine cyclodeaminase family protein [Candidatus Binatia bacterium]
MPIILTENDLAPLYRDPAAMDDLLNAIEGSLCAQSSGAVAGQARVETSLLDSKKKYRIMTSAVPKAGQAMRISALFRGAKDSYFMLLFDGETGDLLALVAGRNLNVWRTGAPAGVACRYLAPKGADHLGLIGSGRQARGQIAAIRRAVPDLRKVKVFSSTKEHRDTFAREMAPWLGVDVEAVDSPRAAVENMPIVSLATSSRSTVIEPQWIKPGALVVSITSGQLPRETVANSRVIVSWKEEVLGGEAPRQPYIAMIADGSWSAEKIAGELGDVILGKISARESGGETVVFESVGMPIWDTVATAWAYRWAVANGAGTRFSLD